MRTRRQRLERQESQAGKRRSVSSATDSHPITLHRTRSSSASTESRQLPSRKSYTRTQSTGDISMSQSTVRSDVAPMRGSSRRRSVSSASDHDDQPNRTTSTRTTRSRESEFDANSTRRASTSNLRQTVLTSFAMKERSSPLSSPPPKPVSAHTEEECTFQFSEPPEFSEDAHSSWKADTQDNDVMCVEDDVSRTEISTTLKVVTDALTLPAESSDDEEEVYLSCEASPNQAGKELPRAGPSSEHDACTLTDDKKPLPDATRKQSQHDEETLDNCVNTQPTCPEDCPDSLQESECAHEPDSASENVAPSRLRKQFSMPARKTASVRRGKLSRKRRGTVDCADEVPSAKRTNRPESGVPTTDDEDTAGPLPGNSPSPGTLTQSSPTVATAPTAATAPTSQPGDATQESLTNAVSSPPNTQSPAVTSQCQAPFDSQLPVSQLSPPPPSTFSPPHTTPAESQKSSASTDQHMQSSVGSDSEQALLELFPGTATLLTDPTPPAPKVPAPREVSSSLHSSQSSEPDLSEKKSEVPVSAPEESVETNQTNEEALLSEHVAVSTKHSRPSTTSDEETMDVDVIVPSLDTPRPPVISVSTKAPATLAPPSSVEPSLTPSQSVEDELSPSLLAACFAGPGQDGTANGNLPKASSAVGEPNASALEQPASTLDNNTTSENCSVSGDDQHVNASWLVGCTYEQKSDDCSKQAESPGSQSQKAQEDQASQQDESCLDEGVVDGPACSSRSWSTAEVECANAASLSYHTEQSESGKLTVASPTGRQQDDLRLTKSSLSVDKGSQERFRRHSSEDTFTNSCAALHVEAMELSEAYMMSSSTPGSTLEHAPTVPNGVVSPLPDEDLCLDDQTKSTEKPSNTETTKGASDTSDEDFDDIIPPTPPVDHSALLSPPQPETTKNPAKTQVLETPSEEKAQQRRHSSDEPTEDGFVASQGTTTPRRQSKGARTSPPQAVEFSAPDLPPPTGQSPGTFLQMLC